MSRVRTGKRGLATGLGVARLDRIKFWQSGYGLWIIFNFRRIGLFYKIIIRCRPVVGTVPTLRPQINDQLFIFIVL